MKRIIAFLMAAVLTAALMTGCGSGTDGGKAQLADGTVLAEGIYTANFNTDSSMFHVNEIRNGRGILVVHSDGMSIHIMLPSTNIVNLYCGTAEDAQKEGAVLLKPTMDYVKYTQDGDWEPVNFFDVPVPYLDKEFDLAIIGTKGKWYDHKVSVTNPAPLGEVPEGTSIEAEKEAIAAYDGPGKDGTETEATGTDTTGTEATGTDTAGTDTTGTDTAGADAAGSTSSEITDQQAADAVADKIDAIYVQKWTEETDAMCADARKSWDALTDAQKQMVEGQAADSDYFGLDTGDASADDPLNADGIGEKELLVVSFGTSFNDSRAKDIGGIEKALQAAYPDWSVRRAFSSQIILNHVLARDGEKIDNVEQALERAAANGVKQLVIQPTHLMHGAEYDEIAKTVESFGSKFESVEIAEPLLGRVGADETEINADKEAVAKAVTEAAVSKAGFESLEAADQDKTAFVFMGHGTSHTAKVTYSQMQAQMEALGYKNVFVGTVEGEPEDTSCEAVIGKVKAAGYTKVVLRPLMVVAGDHANNDMAGEDADSWLSLFKADGSFEKVDAQIDGMGSIPAIEQIYVEHAGEYVK